MSMAQEAGGRKSVVEVVALKPLNNKGNLRAFASVRLGGVVINNCRIIQQLGQRAWVSLPQQEYTTRAGERRYAPVVELNDNLKKQVCEAVLTAWERGGGV
jgi:DNA-binding cell septation regulator SpoVG